MDYDDDTPFTLSEACAVLLRGIATPSTLRAQIRAGDLQAEFWGHGYRVTPRMIREWRERKRYVPPPKPVAPPSGPKPWQKQPAPSDRMGDAKAHLMMLLERRAFEHRTMSKNAVAWRQRKGAADLKALQESPLPVPDEHDAAMKKVRAYIAQADKDMETVLATLKREAIERGEPWPPVKAKKKSPSLRKRGKAG